jgi:hypothetical protein
MEPLNQEERSKAMIRFMVFFSVTLVLTVFAFYFDVMTRNKSAEINREKLKKYTNSERELDRLMLYFTKTKESIDRITFDKNKTGAHELAYKAVSDTLDKFKTEDEFLVPVTDALRLSLQQLAINQRDGAEAIKNGETMSKKEAEIKSLEEKVKLLEEKVEEKENALNICLGRN